MYYYVGIESLKPYVIELKAELDQIRKCHWLCTDSSNSREPIVVLRDLDHFLAALEFDLSKAENLSTGGEKLYFKLTFPDTVSATCFK